MKSLVITIIRKPLEGTLAQNCLEHGTGALNINASRISTEEDLNGGAYAEHGSDRHDGSENWRYKRKGGAGAFEQPPGRWPANLILVHQPGCECVGLKTIQSDGHYPSTRPVGSQISGPSGHRGQSGLVEKYTKDETVEEWVCIEECPVRDLDEQSGDRPGMPLQQNRNGLSSKGYSGGWGADPGAKGYGDKGGASRFYKQFKQ